MIENTPEQKKPAINRFVLIVAIFFAALLTTYFLLIILTSNDKDKGKQNDFKIGQTVTINDTFNACVTEVSSSSSLSYTNSWGFPTSEYADNFFIIVKITIENIGKETCSFDESNFQLVMEGDYVYESYILLSNTGRHDLAPLQKTNFTVVFDAVYPHTEKNYILKFYDSSWFSDNFSCNFRLY